ncbi:MAG: hypothetical protein ACP5ER_05710 [Candidatus Bathyarchaeales archaeon]
MAKIHTCDDWKIKFAGYIQNNLFIKQRIPLEICLTSNVLSGAVQSVHNHPFKELYEAKAFVTLNTDDPSLCRTTLTSEYVLAAETFQLDLADIRKIVQNGFSASFIKSCWPERGIVA